MIDQPDLRTTRRKSVSLADPSRVDRLPPHSIEAEQGVLGCVMLNPDEALTAAIDALRADPGRFYDLRHREIFSVMVELWTNKSPVDPITIQQRLKDLQKLDAVGGLPYIMSLADAVPSAANLEYYTTIVNEKFLLRNVIKTGTELVGRVYEHEGSVDELIDYAQRQLTGITNARYTSNTTNIKSTVHECIADMEWGLENRGKLRGLPSGFADLDRLTLGLHAGEMVVIAARPSVGKTALAMNIVENLAIGLRVPCGVFSLEMPGKAIVTRMIASQARLNIRDIYNGVLTERDFPRLTSAASKVANAPIHIEDARGINTLELRAKARRMVQEHGVKIFFIDYLQLLQSPRGRDSREQEISDISNNCKSLAGELNVPVIVLCQLNREMEKDKGRKPRLSDLRGSGSIEQDGDTIVLLYNAKDEDDEDHGRGCPTSVVGAIVAKQRNGPCDAIELLFRKQITRFENMARDSVADVEAQPALFNG